MRRAAIRAWSSTRKSRRRATFAAIEAIQAGCECLAGGRVQAAFRRQGVVASRLPAHRSFYGASRALIGIT